MRLGRVLLGVAFVAGCAHDCTDIGCIRGVSVSFPDTFDLDLLPVIITTCADDVCHTERIDPTDIAADRAAFGLSPIVPLDEQRERDVMVTIEVRSESTGKSVVSVAGVGHLTRVRPNGSGCPPTCYSTSMRYDAARNQLVEDER